MIFLDFLFIKSENKKEKEILVNLIIIKVQNRIEIGIERSFLYSICSKDYKIWSESFACSLYLYFLTSQSGLQLEFISVILEHVLEESTRFKEFFQDSKRGAFDPIAIFALSFLPSSTHLLEPNGTICLSSLLANSRGKRKYSWGGSSGAKKYTISRVSSTIPLIVEKLGKKGNKEGEGKWTDSGWKDCPSDRRIIFFSFSSFFLSSFPLFSYRKEREGEKEGILELSGLAKILSQRSQPSCPRKQKSSGCCSFVSYPFSFAFHPPPSLPFFFYFFFIILSLSLEPKFSGKWLRDIDSFASSLPPLTFD